MRVGHIVQWGYDKWGYDSVNKRDIVVLLDGIEGSMFGCTGGPN